MPLTARSSAPVAYRIDIADLHAHLFRVTLTIATPAARQRVRLPVWIPGSYLVREFSKNLQRLQARQGTRALAVAQEDKHTWAVACNPARPLVLHYEVYAFDNSVRTAWLDAGRGFFNGTSLCLQVEGREAAEHHIEIAAPAATPRWQLATGLVPIKTDAAGFGSYTAADYDELVDCPVEMGPFWSTHFTACGVPHRLVVAGAPASFDGARLAADAQKICEAAIRFWHPRGKPPHRNYLFLLNAVDDSYGGLEHRNSTALICSRRDLPRLGESRTPDGYTTLQGLISHEYFHTWNVKRLRPADFARYDYAAENYTHLLWFFEGFTSYYDDLLLRRAGLIDNASYLRLLGKTVNQVMQTPGRLVQSVAQASFDAWVKYYRPDENTPNATVSYYTKGALVALCLDLTLRAEGRTTLDAVMRSLWKRCRAGPMEEADVLAVLEELAGRPFAAEMAAWVHGTGELPLRELLERHGATMLDEPSQPAQRLGLRVAENGGSVQIKTVLRGAAAERAGMAAGDEWLGVEAAGQGWRIARLDDIALYAGSAKHATAIIARDRRLLRLPLELGTESRTARLLPRDSALLDAWLGHAGATPSGKPRQQRATR
ncbi:peptidase M61 [Ramlibacter sp. H39-3-26]|uniref:M61 family metallopeptidase n=1 Tax=Curvibacter soli TaxID=3031331 RepID=UPI0023D9E664|nr:peptidase M61 [Ramlibacter sp. H39-3-26]MDF1484758.1 peptidase M61 [Ramlibacter sp. H39-3-26]